DQGGDVGVVDGHAGALEAGFDGRDGAGPAPLLVADPLVDQDVGVDGDGQRQDKARDAREGEGRLGQRHGRHDHQQVEDQTDDGDTAEHDAVEQHDEDDDGGEAD